MKIKAGKSKVYITIPEGYKKQKPDKDMKDIEVYAKTTPGSVNMMAIFPADNPMNFNMDSDELVAEMVSDTRASLSADNGLIEFDAGKTIEGYDYAYGLLKNKKEDGEGVWYNLRMNLKTDEKTVYEVQATFEEVNVTGTREAVVFSLLKKCGLAGEEAFRGWMQDTYDENYESGFLMNLSERPGFDVLFGNHPLSQARELTDAIIFGILKKEEKKPKHRKPEDDKDTDNIQDEKELIMSLLEYTVEDKKKKYGRQPETKPQKEKKVSINDQITMALNEYNRQYDLMKDAGFGLYHQRDKAVDLIEYIENLINSIANHPKSFDTDFEMINEIRRTFRSADDFVKKELDAAKKQAVGAGAGVAAGVGVAALAPQAALWAATTFGTASTGTAISTLSGAAATNAALAWLGGGALAAGGEGIAGGTALLALAGPVGWGIAGASILASVALFTHGKLKSTREKEDELRSVKSNIEKIREVTGQIENLTEKTLMLEKELSQRYMENLSQYNCNYAGLSDDKKLQLGTLVNNTKSIAALIRLKIESGEDD